MAEGNNNQVIYALLVGVGNYEAMEMVNLPTYKIDLIMLGQALIQGLKASEDSRYKREEGFFSEKDLLPDLFLSNFFLSYYYCYIINYY